MLLPGESWPLHGEPVQTEWPTYVGKKLVKGYMTKPVWVECKSDSDYVEPCARHVAMFEDGTIKITKGYVRLLCSDFHRKKFQWEVIAEMPTNVQYIGNYPADM